MKKEDRLFALVVCCGVALAFLFFYGGASWLSGFVPWRVRLDLPFEQAIPFVPWVSVVYLSMDVLVGIAPFVLKEPKKLAAFAAVMVTEMIIAAVFFIALPVSEPFPTRIVDGSASSAFWLADTLNLERNFFPSLHVAFSVTAARAYGGKGWWAWALAIAASTLLLHEHCVIDVVGGVVLALIVHAVWFEKWVKVDLAEKLRTEWVVFVTLMRVGLRHRRYLIINVALYAFAAVVRGRRALRTGYALLQLIDDVLDGDHPLPEGETSELEFAARISDLLTPAPCESGERAGVRGPTSAHEPLTRRSAPPSPRSAGRGEQLARAFVKDAPPEALELARRLIVTMSNDFRRKGTAWTEAQLRAHHRATFADSLDVLLVCGGSKVRASQLPATVDLLGWASVVRDLDEDLSRGLINLPAGADREAWLRSQELHARTLMHRSDAELARLDDSQAATWLGLIARSTRKYLSSPLVPSPLPHSGEVDRNEAP